jgi:interferon-induced GTP-binding protein Mx
MNGYTRSVVDTAALNPGHAIAGAPYINCRVSNGAPAMPDLDADCNGASLIIVASCPAAAFWLTSPTKFESTMDLLASYGNETRPLLDVINDLRADAVGEEVDMPQIAVIGDQSSGKSSVLESLSGIPFPRGAGLVTRCPIVLRMKGALHRKVAIYCTADRTNTVRELNGDDAAGIEAYIRKLAESLCPGASFSKESITVDLQAPDVPDLTLIDLPGIVRNITTGQDPGDIKKIGELLNHFMQPERTILLAMVPANQDIATVEALQLCSQHDPHGDRTIAVLTKPDLIDRGAEGEALAVLRNQKKPLKLGYFVVKCKSQRQIDEQIGRAEARAAEARFFEEHEVWGSAAVAELRTQMGMPQLSVQLTAVLKERIRAGLPDIYREVESKLRAAKQELASLGEDSINGSPGAAMAHLVVTFCNLLTNAARGNHGFVDINDDPAARLCTANSLFKEFKEAVLLTKPPRDDDFVAAIKTEMDAFTGEELPGFMNFSYFKYKLAAIIRDWGVLCQQLLADAQEAVSDVIELLLKQQQLQRSPLLRQALQAAAQEVS